MREAGLQVDEEAHVDVLAGFHAALKHRGH